MTAPSLPQWTYSGDPANSSLDLVRFLIGDTNPKDQLLWDGEINYLISKYNKPLNAAIQACETIVAKFSRMCDERVGQVDIKFSQKIKQYLSMRDTLRMRVALTDVTPLVPSIYISAKQANDQAGNLVRPDFTKHMMENDQNSNTVNQQTHANSDGLDDSGD